MALTAKKVYAILKHQISDMEAKLNSPVRYRGTVATADLLPLNPDIGDMYNIESKSIYGEAGMNVAWNGVVWDTMGAPIDMSLYLTKEGADTTIQNMVNEYLEKNPVKPGATTEQAQQIEQNKKDVASLKKDISNKITKFYASNQGETHITDSDNGKIQDMVLYGKSEQNQYKGINLLPTDISYFEMIEVLIPKGTRIFWATDGTPALGGNFKFYNEDKTQETWFGVDIGKTAMTSTMNMDAKYMQFLISEAQSVKICLGIGDDPVYEPYTGGQPSPSLDYPQEIKSIVNPTVKVSNEDGTKSQTVTLPYTLNAIPVSSGGNVTIDGQQYIADYVDVERGKYVQMIQTDKVQSNITWTIQKQSKGYSLGYSSLYKNGISTNKPGMGKAWKSNVGDSSEAWRNAFSFGKSDVFWIVPYENDGNITSDDINAWLVEHPMDIMYPLAEPIETDLTLEENEAFKALVTNYPVTNISVTSDQLDGYTVFNYQINMVNGWNYVKQQIGDTREYIYDIDARTQDTDLQAAEAYVNSEYAVALTELEVM